MEKNKVLVKVKLKYVYVAYLKSDRASLTFFAQVTKSGRASYFVSYMRESFKRMKLPKYCLPKVSTKVLKMNSHTDMRWLLLLASFLSLCSRNQFLKGVIFDEISHFVQKRLSSEWPLFSPLCPSFSTVLLHFFLHCTPSCRTCTSSAPTRSKCLQPSRSGIRITLTACTSLTLQGSSLPCH